MKQIDKCSSCKHLEKLEDNSYKGYYHVCDELDEYLWVETDAHGFIRIDYQDKFGCIAWEAKDE